LQHGHPVPVLPAPDLVSVPVQPDWPAGFADAMGWLEAGPVLLRLDIAERVAAELAWATRRGATALPAALASRFSRKADMLPVVLRRLGFRILPAGGLAAGEYGPPAPAMVLPLRRRRPVVVAAGPSRSHGPFAALAALKR
jgi:ATP-dependent RNA helicase SUPV3L1/SUV3